MPTLVAYMAILFVLLPFSVVALFYFSVAVRRSFQNWEEVQTWGDAVGWVGILLLEIGGAGLYLFLVYLAILALHKNVGI